MKFRSDTPDYFSNLPERFSAECGNVCVVQGPSICETENVPSTIYIIDTLEAKDVVSILNQKSIDHVIQNNEPYFEEDLWTTGNIILTPEKYFSDGAKSLIEKSENAHLIDFAGKADKSRLKDEVANFIKDCGNQGLAQSVDSIVEELFMNATLDAPKEAAKRGIQVQPGGTSNVLQLESHETKLVISCSDPFGALDVNKFLSRMNEVYLRGAGEAINLRGQGGAGLGCVIMFENCMSMFIGVHKNKSTRVSCVLPIGINNRQRANTKKSLHRLEL